jgi:YVTN family beta-propeller protein
MASTKKLFRPTVLLGALAIVSQLTLAQTPSPALVITSKGKGSSDCVLQIIDPAAAKIVARVHLGGSPHDVAVSSDGRFAFTSNLTAGAQWVNYPTAGPPTQTSHLPNPLPDDSISIIDLVAQKELRRIAVGPGSEPHGIAYAAGKVYFTVEGYKLVARLDPATNRIDWMGGVGENRVHELVITKDATKIFTSDLGSDTVAAIAPWDPSTDVQTDSEGGHPPPPWKGTLIHVGRWPEGIGMSPDEKEVWTLNRADGSVSIIDVDSKKVIQTVDLRTKDPMRIAFTPDGNRVLIADGKSGELLILDRRTRTEINRIKDVGKDAHGIVVAPDGAHAYVAAVGDNIVAIVDMKTLEVTARIPVGDQSEGMAWVGGK